MEGHTGVMNGASLVKQVIAHVALEVIDDLDEPVAGDITVRHVLTTRPGSRTGGPMVRSCDRSGLPVSAGATPARASCSSNTTSKR